MEPDPVEATVTTPHSPSLGKDARTVQRESLDRIDSRQSPRIVDGIRNIWSRSDSETSLSVDDLMTAKERRRRQRRLRGQQELDQRINQQQQQKQQTQQQYWKKINRKEALPQNCGSSSTTLMNSSLLQDCSSENDFAGASPEKKVCFSVAEYREYKVTVAVNDGGIPFPLTLDWESIPHRVVDLTKRQDRGCRPARTLNIRKRQRRLLAMGLSKSTLVALERRRRIQLAGEWAFGNNPEARPDFGSRKILHYSIF